MIGRDDVEAILSSGYCYPDLWVDEYIARRRQHLAPDAVDWLLATTGAELATSVSEFPQRAARYARLAAVAALHDLGPKAEEFGALAASNLLAHGNHKDGLLDNVLTAAVAFHRGEKGSAEHAGLVRGWLARLAPAVAHVREFTDGDETRHLPRELAVVLREVAPEALPAYYCWLVDTEQYYNATDAFEEYLRGADLADPVAQAVARTAVETEGLRVLGERAAAGSPCAGEALAALVAYLGPGCVPAESGDQLGGGPPRSSAEPPPPPQDFPPADFDRYLAALREAGSFRLEEDILGWVRHWRGQGQGAAVYDALRSAADRGVNVRCHDELYDLAVQVEGRDRAYRWLVAAQVEHHGWSRFYTHEADAVRRWEAVKRYHPGRWYDFLRDTVVSDRYRHTRYVGQDVFVRLVRYLVLVGQRDLARRSVQAMVDGALDLVSPLALTPPAWVAEGVGAP